MKFNMPTLQELRQRWKEFYDPSGEIKNLEGQIVKLPPPFVSDERRQPIPDENGKWVANPEYPDSSIAYGITSINSELRSRIEALRNRVIGRELLRDEIKGFAQGPIPGAITPAILAALMTLPRVQSADDITPGEHSALMLRNQSPIETIAANSQGINQGLDGINYEIPNPPIKKVRKSDFAQKNNSPTQAPKPESVIPESMLDSYVTKALAGPTSDYYLRSGESINALYNIAFGSDRDFFGTDAAKRLVAKTLEINGIADPTKIPAGTRLKLFLPDQSLGDYVLEQQKKQSSIVPELIVWANGGDNLWNIIKDVYVTKELKQVMSQHELDVAITNLLYNRVLPANPHIKDEQKIAAYKTEIHLPGVDKKVIEALPNRFFHSEMLSGSGLENKTAAGIGSNATSSITDTQKMEFDTIISHYKSRIDNSTNFDHQPILEDFVRNAGSNPYVLADTLSKQTGTKISADSVYKAFEAIGVDAASYAPTLSWKVKTKDVAKPDADLIALMMSVNDKDYRITSNKNISEFANDSLGIAGQHGTMSDTTLYNIAKSSDLTNDAVEKAWTFFENEDRLRKFASDAKYGITHAALDKLALMYESKIIGTNTNEQNALLPNMLRKAA